MNKTKSISLVVLFVTFVLHSTLFYLARSHYGLIRGWLEDLSFISIILFGLSSLTLTYSYTKNKFYIERLKTWGKLILFLALLLLTHSLLLSNVLSGEGNMYLFIVVPAFFIVLTILSLTVTMISKIVAEKGSPILAFKISSIAFLAFVLIHIIDRYVGQTYPHTFYYYLAEAIPLAFIYAFLPLYILVILVKIVYATIKSKK